MHFFFNDLLIIIGTFYLILRYFFVVLNKLNLVFQKIKKNKDTRYILCIFWSFDIQVDKILGENLLSKDNYFIYFLFYKFASIFQIFGSILPTYKEYTYIKEKITSEIKNELKFMLYYYFF